MRIAAVLLSSLLLSACATPEQRADQTLAAFGPYCDRLGYQRDTDAWRHCVQVEDAKTFARGELNTFVGFRRSRFW